MMNPDLILTVARERQTDLIGEAVGRRRLPSWWARKRSEPPAETAPARYPEPATPAPRRDNPPLPAPLPWRPSARPQREERPGPRAA